MEKQRLEVLEFRKPCDFKSLATTGDIEAWGMIYVGDYTDTFEMGPVRCGGMIVADGLNAGEVFATEGLFVRNANLEQLNCGGDVEAEYLFCELGAYVLGDINVDYLVSETHHVFCGGTFTGKFKGDPEMLHENFSDWGNLKNYL